MSKGIGELQRRILFLITWDSTTPDGTPWAWDADELKDWFDNQRISYDLRSIRRAARGLAKRGYLLETGGDAGTNPPYAHDWYAWLPSDEGKAFVLRKFADRDIYGAKRPL